MFGRNQKVARLRPESWWAQVREQNVRFFRFVSRRQSRHTLDLQGVDITMEKQLSQVVFLMSGSESDLLVAVTLRVFLPLLQGIAVIGRTGSLIPIVLKNISQNLCLGTDDQAIDAVSPIFAVQLAQAGKFRRPLDAHLRTVENERAATAPWSSQ